MTFPEVMALADRRPGAGGLSNDEKAELLAAMKEKGLINADH